MLIPRPLADESIAVFTHAGLTILITCETLRGAERLRTPAQIGGACDGLLAFCAVDFLLGGL